MKKLIIVLVAVLALFMGVLVYTGVADRELLGNSTASTATASTTGAAGTTAAEAAALRTLDYEALYALHAGDEVVMTINGEPVTWDDYFYWVYYYGSNVEYYMNLYAMYGMGFDWEDPMSAGDDTTYLDYVLEMAESGILQMITIEQNAAAAGAVLSEEDLAAIEAQKQEDISSIIGEGATEEELYAELKSQYMTPAFYERMLKTSYLYRQGFTAAYGEDGALISEEEAAVWLEENGYMASNHILLPTIDFSTYAALSDDEIAANKATAEKISAELRAIEDTNELLARFAELKAEYDADSGKEAYPDGYTFTSGTMVEAFETTTLALEVYGVSEPVESSYGYHVIIRMPLTADNIIDYSDDGTAMTARATMANELWGQTLQDYYDNAETVWVDGVTAPALADYLVTAE